MKNRIIETATIHLRADKTEQDLVAASETFQRAFLDHQPGFVRRELLHKGGREYLDLVYWQDREAKL